MHDIMHDFALHLSRNSFLTINKQVTSLKHHKSKKPHHLFIGFKDPSTVCDVGRLRTCLAYRIPRDVTLDMCRHLRLIRTLNLRWCGLDQIPQEIAKLIHLRTLDLSHNQSLSELPETIGDLYNLKCLFLEDVNLNKFPQSIGKLINLRILSIDPEKGKLLALESLCKLVNLQKLRKVHVEARSRGLGFLRNLNQLREDIEIVFESDYNDDVDANEANLKSKNHIKKLILDFNGKDVAAAVVEALQPSTEVKVVKIVNYRGTKLPSWVTSLNDLTKFKVTSAENVVSLPPLGMLPNLEKLKIHKLGTLKFIGRDFLGIDNNSHKRITIENAPPSSSFLFSAFPALEELSLSCLYELEKWEDLKVEEEDMKNAMPKLKILTIERCPKLGVMPIRLLRKVSTSLKELYVDDIRLPSDLRITREEVGEWTVGPLLPPFPNLDHLEINDYMGYRLPSWITCLNYLKDLHLCDAENVVSLPPLGHLPFLETLSICNFSSLTLIGREFVGIDLEKKVSNSSTAIVSSSSSIAYFPKLVKLRLGWLFILNEWEDIRVEEEEDTSLHFMPNLRSLEISRCPSLEVLPHRLFHKASLLQNLHIEDDEKRPLTSTFSSFSFFSSFDEVFGPMVTAISKLGEFRISNFKEPRLPTWITSLNYLTQLTLSGSKSVTSLPPLGKLPRLKILEINDFSVLKSVGREFLGIEDDNNQKNIITTSITSFPNLKRLYISNWKELGEWEDIKAEGEVDDAITLMPHLHVLYIHGCPKLEVLPHRLLRRASSPLIMELHISDCGIAGERIIEDTELFLRLKALYFNNKNLKKKRETR